MNEDGPISLFKERLMSAIKLVESAGFTISVDDSTIDPHPDTVVTITKSAVWNGTVSATINGTTIPLTAINTTQKSFTLDIYDLLPGEADADSLLGTHQRLR